MPPAPPPLTDTVAVDHEGPQYPPVVPPSWGTQVLNNSLPMSLQSQRSSPGPTLVHPPQGHPLAPTSGSSSTSSLSFTAVQNHASELERTADALRMENLQLQMDNAQLQQRVACLEEELKRYCTTAPFA